MTAQDLAVSAFNVLDGRKTKVLKDFPNDEFTQR
jgi:hypothetical protein